jgi:isoleucyl-tRNA synthetase
VKEYPEYKNLNLPEITKEVLQLWKDDNTFEKSVSTREGAEPFVFYEGPPSANGMPGIHHVMGRTIKDLFCRYQTLKGKQVKRKAGWDTHGLPIELAVEKTLGIRKEDIGKKITIEDYNKACRTEVMKYQDKWEELTRMMGYWVDMEHPYITYENNYIESVWWLLKKLYDKKLLYKGYTIQPYSPAAGTGLSTHELNQPGCYRNVRDTTAIAMFKVSQKSKENFYKLTDEEEIYFLAWTTTPWTLPSNTALAVGKNIDYIAVKTTNPYSKNEVVVILASTLRDKYFGDGKSKLPVGENIGEFKGNDLEGIHYEQLLPFKANEKVDLNGKLLPFGEAGGVVVCGDFVTTEDGTGIVHIAPSFGADDFRVAKQNGIGSLTLVDRRGKFLPEVKDDIFLYGDEYVKEAYLSDAEKQVEFQKQKKILEANGKIKELKEYLSVDERIVLKLQEEGKLFKKEKYEHSYPHCWRTDKPILYYPLDSWFVKVTEYKTRLVELNKTINWKPAHTGTGRFGEWLNNLQDWNLSRSRFWGIPLPIWRTEDGKEEKIIGSIEEFSTEIDKAIKHNFMLINPIKEPKKFKVKYLDNHPGVEYAASSDQDLLPEENASTFFDLHKPYIDRVFLVSDSGKKMVRESDLIDVWFDSGAMPYAQWHYPFDNKEQIDPPPGGGSWRGASFPADFIAEGVDQTRGWFYTLHAIAVLCFDSVAYKNVVSNGLVLDKNGNKMSKRLGNTVDPFATLEKYGPDAVRWYMVTNADPWDNLKFDLEGVAEKQRSFFGTLYNIYSFFALYANIDKFVFAEKEVPLKDKPEIDRWILSELNSLIKAVDDSYGGYEPTKAGRAIELFVDEHLSNWYVRLCRRRFWKGDYTQDKISAYQTLYRCLEVVAQLSSPIAPFFCDKLFKDLNDITKRQKAESVHLSFFPKADESTIDKLLEERMEMAQKISSMILSIRKKENIRVRQPLTKIRIPILDDSFKKKLEAVKDLILSEVNVKSIEFVSENDAQIVKNMKLNFKTLGKKCGKDMKGVQAFATENAQAIISSIEKTGNYDVILSSGTYMLDNEDVEIIPVDIPGWKVANSGSLTVALDITITTQLRDEGIAREIVNRIQNLRKENSFEVTDKIEVKLKNHPQINTAVLNNLHYIRTEILANTFEIVHEIIGKSVEIEIDEGIKTRVAIDRIKQLN